MKQWKNINFFFNHKDVESSHIADKILEGKEIDRILSKDSDLSEILIAVPTAWTMFLKVN